MGVTTSQADKALCLLIPHYKNHLKNGVSKKDRLKYLDIINVYYFENMCDSGEHTDDMRAAWNDCIDFRLENYEFESEVVAGLRSALQDIERLIAQVEDY